MTLLEINLTDVLSETDPDDKVIVWAPVLREGPAGQLVGPRRKSIPLTDGVGSDEVVPGPLMVQVQCKAMSDTRPREVVVPEEGPVTLTALFDGAGAFTYSPAVVGQVAQYRNEAIQAAAAAEAAATTAATTAAATAATNVETQLSGHVASAEDAAVRAEAGAAVVGDAQAVLDARDDTVAAVATLGDAQTVLDARDTAVDAADRAEIAAAAVAFTEDPAGSGLYTFPTTAGA